MKSLEPVVQAVLALRRSITTRAVLVGISGIDGSGKGFITTRLARRLLELDVHVAVVNADGWLNLPRVRFSEAEPARHFYKNALRMEELFERLILPLRERRSLTLDMNYTEETAREYRPHRYEFHDIQVILLEGIFLLKPGFRDHFDVTCWVDCSFETALARAINRRQEGLSPEATARAFETIYFPAQRLHLERDRPREFAAHLIANDEANVSMGCSSA